MSHTLSPKATPLRSRLLARGKPISATVIGIGSIGNGLAYQVNATQGFSLLGIADIDLAKARRCADWLGRPYRVVETETEANQAISAGELVVSADGRLVTGLDDAEVMIEASSAVLAGAHHAESAISSGSHVVMMNYEAELMYGPPPAAARGSVWPRLHLRRRRPTHGNQDACGRDRLLGF